MIEEKTKEPQSQAPAAPVKGREKLRSFWAKVQISGLLRRHRFRRKTQRHMNDVAKKLRASAVVLAVGEALYALGFAAEYMVVRTGRGIAAVARKLARWCRNALHTIIATAFPGAAQMFKDLLAPLYLFFKGLGAVAAHANDVRRERGFGASVKAAGRYFVGGLKRNLSLLPRTAMYILPLCMLAVFVTVWNRTMAQPYALAVQVNGQTVGYVANEEVFNLAKEDVMQRINYAGSEQQWNAIAFEDGVLGWMHKNFNTEQHTFGAWVTDGTRSCAQGVTMARSCGNDGCDLVQTVELPALGHIWDSGTLLTAPEGVRCGIVEHTCSRCNGTGYEVLDPEIWAYEQFGDVDPTLWSYEGIQFCVMMGFMSGMDTHVFAPRGVTTRAQLVQILYNFVGGPEVSGETPFTDLTANWYKDAVLWAYQTGVTSGTSETTFAPDDPVTREQVAVLLYEFADKVLEVGGAETPADLSRFPDGDQVSSWAREAMADAVALGIINGTKVDDQVFLAPQGSATRDQIATMFEGFCASLA